MNPLAEELNNKIKECSPLIYELLSKKGKAIFFPSKGILAQSAEAKGKDINATIGVALEDDFSPMRLSTISNQLTTNPKDALLYAPSYGKPELRQKWMELIYQKNPSLQPEISVPVVTNALTHGLSLMGYMFVDPDDKILMPDLFWGNYKLIFINAYGAVLDTFETFKGNSFNVEGLKQKLDEPGEKKILLLNFPNNPSGYTPTDEEVEKITEAIKEAADSGKKILAIIDDAYFGLVYKEGIYKESIFAKLADLHENVLAVKIDGATKEDYVWGLRVGFITYCTKKGSIEAYKALEDKTAGAVRGNISNVSHLSQSIVLKSLDDPDYKAEKKKKYVLLKSRYEEVVDVLEKNPDYKEEFEALPFNSGYFMCIKLKNHDGEKIRQILLEKYSTGVIAIDKILRIAFSSIVKKDIAKLFYNIYNACKGA